VQRQTAFELPCLGHERLGTGAQGFAQGIELETLAGAVEQLHVEALLQILQR